MSDTFPNPSYEPLNLTAGDTFTWQRDLASYGILPTDWTLSYAFIPKTTGNSPIYIDATDNGDGTFLVSVDPSTTAGYSPDDYVWKAMVTSRTTTERHTLYQGHTTIAADFATTAQADYRTQVEKTLEALNAMLFGKLSIDQQSVSIAGRSISKMDLNEVLAAKEKFEELLAKEKQKENNAQKRPGTSNIRINFNSPHGTTSPRFWRS